jgi:hypothetical protein
MARPGHIESAPQNDPIRRSGGAGGLLDSRRQRGTFFRGRCRTSASARPGFTKDLCRVFGTLNDGRGQESDLLEGLVAMATEVEALRHRQAPLDMQPAEFREIGHRLVDQIADRLAALRHGRVTPHASPEQTRRAIAAEQPLPPAGTDAGALVRETADLLFDGSVFNGHPRFWGYITSSPAPIGMFGDLLAAAINQNVGAWQLAPLATEIERQAVRWIAELIGYPTTCGGLLVSGGNMANFVGIIAARAAKTPWMSVRRDHRAKAAACASTPRRRRTPGFRRPPTCPAWAPMRSAGLSLTTSNA